MKTSQRKPFNLRQGLLIGTTALILLLQVIGVFTNITTPLERMEYAARDLLMRMRGPEKPATDIVIVAIDDLSFNYTGYQWPWPRSYLGEIVDQINAGGAKVVGVDIILFAPDREPSNDDVFAAALAESNLSASVVQITDNSVDGVKYFSFSQPISQYRVAFDGLGVTGVNQDEDAIVRRIQAFATYQDQVYYNWAFEIAGLYLGIEPKITPVTPTQAILEFNGQTIPLPRGNQMLVNFAGPAKTYTTYPAASVALGDILEQNPDAFRDKIVLIGATTITLHDVYPTPFSSQTPMPGVEIVANAINTIITGTYIRESPPWMAFLIVIAAALIAALISSSKHPTRTVVLMVSIMAAYSIAAAVIFFRERYVLPLIAPLFMLFLGVVLPTLEQAVSQELEKRRVHTLFSRFISPEMVDQMMSTQDLNSLNKRSDVTIIFSDIRGFTNMSEKLTPEEVVAVLNPYLEAMTQVIYEHGGTVDKYEGDAIIAFFGEPVPYKDHAVRALRASLDMRKALEKLRKQWEKEGRSNHQIEMGVGVNSGEVFVGLLGSAQRINYTVIGDNANLASRLQDLTKTYAWPVLISESTWQQVKDEFDAELADAVVVKGKTQPVNVYKVIGRKGAPKSEQLQSWQK
jgi:adenylate cyclase